MTEDSNNAVSNSFLLDDDSRLALRVTEKIVFNFRNDIYPLLAKFTFTVFFPA